MTAKLLESATVSLRPVESSDLMLMYRLENDTTLWNTASTHQPLSRGTLSRFINSQTGDIYKDRQLRLVIEDATNQSAAGFIDLTDFSPRHLRAEVGLAVLPEHQGRGLGREALRLMEHYAAQTLFVHQLYAYVAADNERSRSLFAHAGYREAGTLHDWLQTNEGYKPVVLYQKQL